MCSRCMRYDVSTLMYNVGGTVMELCESCARGYTSAVPMPRG